MKRLFAVVIICLSSVTMVYGEAAVGSQLSSYKIIESNQLKESVLSENVTRNELYVIVNQLCRNLSVQAKETKFVDILPNSAFTNISKKMAALDLLFPDQLSGQFKPAKEVTFEEAAYICLRLTGQNVAIENSLNTAYEARLLNGIKVNHLNQPINKKSLYLMLENTLMSKKTSTNQSIATFLGLTESDSKANDPQSIGNNAAKAIKIDLYGTQGFIVHFNEIPGEKILNLTKIENGQGENLSITSIRAITTDTYLYLANKPLTGDTSYRITGTDRMTEIVRNTSTGQLFCIEENSMSVHQKQFKINFTQQLNVEQALDIRNYQVDGGLELKSVQFDRMVDGTLDLKTVLIETSSQVQGKVYTLTLKENLKAADGRGLPLTTFYKQIKIYGAGEDVYPPKVGRVIAKSINTVLVQFEDGTELDIQSSENPKNFKVYDTDGKANFEVISAKLQKNSVTGRYTQVLLQVKTLDRNKRYMVEASGVKDVGENMIATNTNFRGSFVLGENEEKAAKLVIAESYSKELIKLIFDKEVNIPEGYSLDNIQLGAGSKAISIESDKNNKTILWIKSTEPVRQTVSVLKIQNIIDNFGNVTTYGEASQYYSTSRQEAERPITGLIDNNKAHGKNVITVNFTKPMYRYSVELLSNYKIDGIDILYVYQTTDHQVKLVTGPQNQGQIYMLNMSGLTDQFGAPLDQRSESKAFIGLSID